MVKSATSPTNLADVIGMKRTFMTGVVIYIAGSLLASVSPKLAMFIIGRTKTLFQLCLAAAVANLTLLAPTSDAAAGDRMWLISLLVALTAMLGLILGPVGTITTSPTLPDHSRQFQLAVPSIRTLKAISRPTPLALALSKLMKLWLDRLMELRCPLERTNPAASRRGNRRLRGSSRRRRPAPLGVRLARQPATAQLHASGRTRPPAAPQSSWQPGDEFPRRVMWMPPTWPVATSRLSRPRRQRRNTKPAPQLRPSFRRVLNADRTVAEATGWSPRRRAPCAGVRPIPASVLRERDRHAGQPRSTRVAMERSR